MDRTGSERQRRWVARHAIRRGQSAEEIAEKLRSMLDPETLTQVVALLAPPATAAVNNKRNVRPQKKTWPGMTKRVARQPRARWEFAAFGPIPETGRYRYTGHVWSFWGVAPENGGFAVICLPTMRRLAAFDTREQARRFCERIDGYTDWSGGASPEDDGLTEILRQAAAEMAGHRPDHRS